MPEWLPLYPVGEQATTCTTLGKWDIHNGAARFCSTSLHGGFGSGFPQTYSLLPLQHATCLPSSHLASCPPLAEWWKTGILPALEQHLLILHWPNGGGHKCDLKHVCDVWLLPQPRTDPLGLGSNLLCCFYSFAFFFRNEKKQHKYMKKCNLSISSPSDTKSFWKRGRKLSGKSKTRLFALHF